MRAGRYADSVFAPAEAARHWQRALALSDDAPFTHTVEGVSLAGLFGAAEDALELSGDEEAAQALAEQALVRLGRADAPSRADVLRRAGALRSRSVPEQGLELLDQARGLYERLPASAALVETLWSIAGTVWNNYGREPEVAELVDRAVEVAERAGDRATHLDMLAQQAAHVMEAGHGERAVKGIRALCGQLTERDGPDLHARLASAQAFILLSMGRLAEVASAAAPALELAAGHGMDHALYVATVRSNAFQALVDLGSIDAAARLIDPIPLGAIGLRNRSDHVCRAVLEMLRNDLDGAAQRWTEIRPLPATWLAWQDEDWLWEAELELWRGNPSAVVEKSHALLVRSAAADHGTLSGPFLSLVGPLLTAALRASADLADQARAVQDADALEAAERQAVQLSDLHRHVTPDPFTAGPMRPTASADGPLWQAEWSRLCGRPDAASWERAATEWDVLSRRHRAAYARWRQAEALLASPLGRSAAAPVLRTAAHQAEQHVPLSGAVAALARRARIDLADTGHPGAHNDQPVTRPLGLTERELAVLRLLGEGRSNPEIARTLFISPRTAGVHVTNILRKLDVSSRVQAATIAERAGLLSAAGSRSNG